MRPSRHALKQAKALTRTEQSRASEARGLQMPSLQDFRALMCEVDPDRLNRAEVSAIQSDLVNRLAAGRRIDVNAFAPFWDAVNRSREADMARVQGLAAYRWMKQQPGIKRGFDALQLAAKRRKKPRPLLPGEPAETSFPNLPELLKRPTRKQALAGLMPEEVQHHRDSRNLDAHIAREMSVQTLAMRLDRLLTALRDRHAAEHFAPLALAYSRHLYIDAVGRLRHLDQEYQAVATFWLELAERMERVSAWSFANTIAVASTLREEAKHLRLRQKAYAALLKGHSRVFEQVRHADSSAVDRELLKNLYEGLARLKWESGAKSLMHFFGVVRADLPAASWFNKQLAQLRP